MKRFCISVSAFALLLSVLVVAPVFFFPNRYAQRSMLGMQTVKLDRLARIPGKRIVFLGGSNLSHGLDSPRIEAELGLPVVNMGLNYRLGLRYIVLAAIEHLHPGDIVAIVPEYGFFDDAFYGYNDTLAMVCDIIPSHKRLISGKQWRRLLKYMPRYGARKLLSPQRCFLGSDKSAVAPKYNAQGDYIPDPKRVFDIPLLGIASAENLDSEVMAEIRDLIGKIRDKGAEVVFIPPPFHEVSYGQQKGFVDAIASALKANGTPFAFPPDKLVFQDKYFFDSPYHLNGMGKGQRTALVIEALEKAIR